LPNIQINEGYNRFMKRHGAALLFVISLIFVFHSAQAQSNSALAIVMTADGPIMPPMLEYFNRGIQIAEQRDAEVLIIQLNTPGGSIDTMENMIKAIRDSSVPVVVYVAPADSQAASAGALITMAGHASAMAPRTVIGASSPIDSSGSNIQSTLETKIKEDLKARARTLISQRGPKAITLAEAMVDDAKAVTANEALEAGLIDFISPNVADLLKSLDGKTVELSSGPRTLHTANAHTESLDISFIEQFLLLLTDPNITFLLLAVGVQAVIIELSHPGGWVSGFIGAVCLTLAVYGMGVLTINWFGLIFFIIAFVLFLLDIKAPTHGALTTAGIASFVIGALVLFNSPGTPQFQRVSVPLVIGIGIFFGLISFTIVMFAIRAQRNPILIGTEATIGKTGTAKTFSEESGQVQVGSELWSAEKAEGSEAIRKGDLVEVVEVKGIRVKVRKIK